MQLFLMRHGEASFEANSDKERILTSLGQQQAAQMSSTLTQYASEFDLVLLSPYIRVQQTWAQVSQIFLTSSNVHILDDLIPSADPKQTAVVIQAYAEQFEAKKVLVIAHMPLLGYLVSEMVAGTEPPLFATAGVSLIDFSTGSAEYVWQQSPLTK
ncbi:phosphohistidine phosphatase SixA [Parashewanella spongiae]|uniref:Phosphohistidine phosphatase SixA n=1 Tax=Parashewanella spongiae TaxID=342950 RepID=A0A3A6U541_9GAMM|nr:phosphohistidine phosphatase SixA [Parashewanella spongiae]MCL1076901.1 phosphohistidine phosphatase SixA [Parashewanella spongiae]RJY19150.1 phosphohistidine phosphatase SixA [Parashewanella spongiae]